MAALFDVVSQVPSVLITAQDVALDVVDVGFVTKPSGIYAQTPVPASTYAALGQTQTILTYVEPLAAGIEQAAGMQGVTTGRFAQEFNAQKGVLEDVIYFTVEAPDVNPIVGGSNSVEVPVPTSALQEERLYQRLVTAPLAAAYENVVGVAGG